MYKVGICGHFAKGVELLNGQTIKTKELANELRSIFGESQVMLVDTFNWNKKPIKLFIKCCIMIKRCQNIVILPAHNGIKVLLPLFAVLNKTFKRSLHYSVVGGWLAEYLQKHRWLLNFAKNYDAIYVETKYMQEKLNNLGLSNVVYMPNFKRIQVISQNEMPSKFEEPFKLCTFSRVTREKGILEAINATRSANNKLGQIAFTLDIYGPIEKSFEQEFKCALTNNQGFVFYKGSIPYKRSVDVLKNYFALLFPTKHKLEGFPGTIIDAFSAAVPVITTNWQYSHEIVTHSITGYIFELVDGEIDKRLADILMNIYINPEKIINMKQAAIEESLKYNPKIVMQEMITRLKN